MTKIPSAIGLTTSTMTRDGDHDPSLRPYKIAVEVYVVGTLCTLGIVGNLISIVVLGRDCTIRRTTAFMLQMLAVADAVYLVSCLFYQTLNCLEKWTDWLPAAVRRRWPYVVVYAWPTASVAQTATVWLVVVVTADRYVAICRPLHAAQYSTISRARRAVAGVWIAAAVYNLPRFFERVVDVDAAAAVNTTWPPTATLSTEPVTVASTITAVDNRRIAAVRRTAMRENALYVLVYKTCLFFVVRFLLPFAALAFFNLRLIRAIRTSDKIRRHCSAQSADRGGKECQHTQTLVVVVIVFVACELPDLVLRAWIAVHQHAPEHVWFPRRHLLYVNTASNLLLTVNSCINFVIYCFMGRRFRVILLRVIGCDGDRSSELSRLDVSGRRGISLYRTRTLEVTHNRRMFSRRADVTSRCVDVPDDYCDVLHGHGTLRAVDTDREG